MWEEDKISTEVAGMMLEKVVNKTEILIGGNLMAKYKVGDKVRVRQWDDMAKEYGTNYSGDILSHGVFTSEMRKYCGKNVNISYIGKRGYYEIKEDNGDWNWSDDMFETIFKSESEYTGIELLQAIKDGVFKIGDKFTRINKYGQEIKGLTARITNDVFYGLMLISQAGSELKLDEILDYQFKPIKKEPINLTPKNKMLTEQVEIGILGTRKLIDVKVAIKDNKVKATLPSGISGISKCCPEDKFDEYKGIKIATMRAIKKQLIDDCDETLEELCKQTLKHILKFKF